MKLVNAPAFRAALSDRGASCRYVADMTAALERKSPAKYRASSHGLINLLAIGKVSKTADERADAIERVLSVPPGSLFAARTIQRSVNAESAA